MMRIWPLLLLLACGEPTAKKKETPKAEPVVHKKTSVALRVPPFHFQDALGSAVSDKDLKGKVWVTATVFTHCPTHCPAMTQEMYALQKEFRDEEDFRLLTLSIDPARDSVDVLRKFAKSYYAKPGRWYSASSRRRYWGHVSTHTTCPRARAARTASRPNAHDR